MLNVDISTFSKLTMYGEGIGKAADRIEASLSKAYFEFLLFSTLKGEESILL